MAGAYSMLQDYDQAIEWYGKAVAVDPKYVYSYYRIGYIQQYYKNDDCQAFEAYEKYLEIGGPNEEEVEQLLSQTMCGG